MRCACAASDGSAYQLPWQVADFFFDFENGWPILYFKGHENPKIHFVSYIM